MAFRSWLPAAKRGARVSPLPRVFRASFSPRVALSLAAALLALTARAADLDFGDPEKLPPPPKDALGYPSRDPNLDVLPGFIKPPPGYGEVPFYWWLGDPLTKERLTWQLDQLAGKGMLAIQINYAHSTKGGYIWGLTYPSDPPLFSADWWKLVEWFAGEAKKRGMGISLSDYTLAYPSQGWWTDEILRDHPDMHGSLLDRLEKPVAGGAECTLQMPDRLLGATAYKTEKNAVVPGSGIDLRDHIQAGTLKWTAPAGTWKVVAVFSKVVERSIDPLDPRFGPEVIRTFYGRFEEHLPGEAGKALNGFFSDELQFGIAGNLWHQRFAGEFQKRKGYDLLPEIAALFTHIGPRTPKVRMDYHDVLVALEEESYFRPVFDWFYKRGMLFGGDHGSRGSNPIEFDDYFRTQRWMLGAGNDQPGGGRGVVRTKVHSSMNHLYLRPRTWLEGYYGSGWGTTPEFLTQASGENYALGSSLQVLHGLYYSTHGGYWEWAPPCNHFRMPYWQHMDAWFLWSQRMCYTLSQGAHRCDVALIYPVTPFHAGLDGAHSKDVAFDLANTLFNSGMDFDFIDEESIVRSKIEEKELRVSGERFRALIVPSMKAMNFATLQKIAEFKRAGGLVLLVGDAPEASDHAGSGDAELVALAKETFPQPLTSSKQALSALSIAFTRDFDGKGRVLHRRVGERDLYLVCGAPKDSECFFRAQGRPELWDAWTGKMTPLPIIEQNATGTRLKMPLTEIEPQLIVFSPGKPVEAAPQKPVRSAEVSGDWEFELKPTMDNRWGDFRWPPTNTVIGAEARKLAYMDETTPNPGWEKPDFNDSKWPRVTNGFGPKFWKLGPLPENAKLDAVEAELAKLTQIDPAKPVEIDGKKYAWQPYAFSWRFGVEGDPGNEGYHGLKNLITDDFIALGQVANPIKGAPKVTDPPKSRYFLWTSVASTRDCKAQVIVGGDKPAAMWLNAGPLSQPESVTVKSGANPLLLRYDKPSRGHVVFDTGTRGTAPQKNSGEGVDANGKPVFVPSDLAMRWHNNAEILPFDTRPNVEKPAGWYRFTAPPGLRQITIPAGLGNVQAWADGQSMSILRIANGVVSDPIATLEKPIATCAKVAIRIEQLRGAYGGAALPEPIGITCAPGTIALGDWSQIDGLLTYSGGAWYRKTVSINAAPGERVTLNLGKVAATCEVLVNGKQAGIRVASPWTFDISELVKPGENRIEVLVYNTLANHYVTIPTRYRGSTVSGLLGPVTIETQ